MAAERPAQQSGQVYREAQPRGPHAKFLNPVARAPDAEWRAIATNPDPPSFQAGAHVPANAIAAQLAADEVFVSMAPGKLLATTIAQLLGGNEPDAPVNSGRPSIAPSPAGPVNAIGPLLEGAGEAT
jgi:hypothetical protein